MDGKDPWAHLKNQVLHANEAMRSVNNMRDSLLSDVKIFNENRTTIWEVDQPQQQTRLFKHVSPLVLESMRSEKLVFHCHNWAITKNDFNESLSLNTFFNLVSTDDGLP